MLDADGAIVAATTAALARGLMLAASLIMLVALLAVVVRGVRLSRAVRRGDSPAAAGSVPWEGVIVGAALVGIVGGVVGLWATYAHASIMRGDGIAATLGNWFGVWSGVSVAVSIASIVLFVPLRRTNRRVPLAVSITASIAAAVLFAAVGAANELQQPQRRVEALVSVNPAVQGTVVVEPGAAGLNEVRIGLTGPDEDVDKLRRAISSGSATVTMRSLALGLRSQPATVQLDQQGGLVAREVIAEADGRWRVQLDLADGDGPVLADVTLQPNPGYQE
ncbi:hypothetical protein [Arthrobacter sp. Z4-13]